MRRAAKVDTAQQEIVDVLRKAGYFVIHLRRPVDLLVGKTWWNEDPSQTFTRWRLLEVKTPTKSGKRRHRADQEDQDAFIAETGTPVVMSLKEALRALEGL